jgi:hypothetical protein
MHGGIAVVVHCSVQGELRAPAAQRGILQSELRWRSIELRFKPMRHGIVGADLQVPVLVS